MVRIHVECVVCAHNGLELDNATSKLDGSLAIATAQLIEEKRGGCKPRDGDIRVSPATFMTDEGENQGRVFCHDLWFRTFPQLCLAFVALRFVRASPRRAFVPRKVTLWTEPMSIERAVRSMASHTLRGVLLNEAWYWLLLKRSTFARSG